MDIPYIIVAGGKGLRMETNLPKQYIEVNDNPIIFYTVSNLVKAGIKRFIIVMDFKYLKYLKNSLDQIDADIKYVAGGKERIDSVINGLDSLDKKDKIVGIHDSVRPFISMQLINRLHSKITDDKVDAVIPVLKLKDTIKIITDNNVGETLVRSNLRRIGTPQVVKVENYLKAINKLEGKFSLLTDDASILEMQGYNVSVVEGEEAGFKITDTYDLKIFKLLLGEKRCE